VESIAASLRKYGYRGPERPAEVACWLEAQGEDINTLVASAKTSARERRPRQEAFRRALLLAYEGRCAITGCDVETALNWAGLKFFDTDHRDPPRYLFHAIIDADETFDGGNYEAARAQYEAAAEDTALVDWEAMGKAAGMSAEEAHAWRASENLQNRVLEPEELGPMAALLASPESAGITGQVISVDGGYKV